MSINILLLNVCFIQSFLLVNINVRTESFVFFGQTLCILANIADGNTAKDLIVSNDDMLQKVKYYMASNKTCCSNVFKGCCLRLTDLLHRCRDILMWNCSSLPPSASQTSSGTKRTVRDWPYNEWVNIYSRCQDFSLNQDFKNLTQNTVVFLIDIFNTHWHFDTILRKYDFKNKPIKVQSLSILRGVPFSLF